MIETMTTPISDCAITAEVSDGDFRTYAFICRLAWRTHPHAERPYTEVDYAQLAKLHPGVSPLTVSAVRARINRLVKVGLLKRERIDNICWRTYPTLDAPVASHVPKTQTDWVLRQITPKDEMVHRGATPDHTHSYGESLGAIQDDRHMRSTEGWGPSPITPRCEEESLGVIPGSTHHAIAELSVMSASTQTPAENSWVRSQITPSHKIGVSDNTSEHEQDATSPLGAIPDRAQVQEMALPAMSDSAHALELTDLDQVNDQDQQLDHSSDQIAESGDGEMSLNKIPAPHQALADALANLTPQAMSPAGIQECLQQPALTAAWLAYVLEPANGVRKPAAYLRKQVRRGEYPPLSPLPQQVEQIVTRRSYAASISSDLCTLSPSASVGPPAVALAQERTTRWPLDAS